MHANYVGNCQVYLDSCDMGSECSNKRRRQILDGRVCIDHTEVGNIVLLSEKEEVIARLVDPDGGVGATQVALSLGSLHNTAGPRHRRATVSELVRAQAELLRALSNRCRQIPCRVSKAMNMSAWSCLHLYTLCFFQMVVLWKSLYPR